MKTKGMTGKKHTEKTKEKIKNSKTRHSFKKGNKFGELSRGHIAHNKKYKDNRNSYKLIAFRDLPRKCIRCGTEDLRVLEVHHKDKNRLNNKVENLEIVCANCHLIKHNAKIPQYKLR